MLRRLLRSLNEPLMEFSYGGTSAAGSSSVSHFRRAGLRQTRLYPISGGSAGERRGIPPTGRLLCDTIELESL